MSLSRNKRHVAPFVGPPWHVAALWLAAALVAQTTIAHMLAIHTVVPSFVLVVVVWYAIRVDARRAAIYGLIAGVCEDALAGVTGAGWTISTTIAAILTSVLSRGFFADSMPLVGMMTAVATLLRALLFWIVMAIEGYPPGLGSEHLHQALLQALLDVALMIVAMLGVRRFERTS